MKKRSSAHFCTNRRARFNCAKPYTPQQQDWFGQQQVNSRWRVAEFYRWNFNSSGFRFGWPQPWFWLRDFVRVVITSMHDAWSGFEQWGVRFSMFLIGCVESRSTWWNIEIGCVDRCMSLVTTWRRQCILQDPLIARDFCSMPNLDSLVVLCFSPFSEICTSNRLCDHKKK